MQQSGGLTESHAFYVYWYDAIFSEKRYRAEVGEIADIYEERIGIEPITVFDIGCGTGNHALAFQHRGATIWAIDDDKVMEEAAADKGVRIGMPPLQVGLVISLFHVVNYCLTLDALDKLLDMAYASLCLGGMFAFDAWNAHLLEDDPPEATTSVHQAEPWQCTITRRKVPHPVKRSERIVVENVTEIVPWATEASPIAFTWAYEHRIWRHAMLRNRLEAAGFTVLGQPREWNRRSLLWTAVK